MKSSFIRIGDISFFEGPLIILFEDFHNNDLYFYDWVDRDDEYNRWLIYKVIPQELLKFLNRKISHFDLFQHVDEFFVANINNNLGLNNYNIEKLVELPDGYIPNRDSFFDESDCPSFDKIRSFVLTKLQNGKQNNSYHFMQPLLLSFQDIFKENQNTFVDVQSMYTSYSEESFSLETHLEVIALPENNFDISSMYYLYKDKNLTPFEHKNIYA